MQDTDDHIVRSDLSADVESMASVLGNLCQQPDGEIQVT